MDTIRRKRKEQKERLTKLIRYIRDLEYVNPASKNVIASWKEFLKLSAIEQTQRKQEWEDYYRKVKQSPMYTLFQEQKAAAKEKNWKRVRALAGQAKQMREQGGERTIPMPQHPHPWEFESGWVHVYREVERIVRTLNQQQAVSEPEETADIWSEE